MYSSKYWVFVPYIMWTIKKVIYQYAPEFEHEAACDYPSIIMLLALCFEFISRKLRNSLSKSLSAATD